MKPRASKVTNQDRARRESEEIEKLNRAADELNIEAEDVLEYQAWDQLL